MAGLEVSGEALVEPRRDTAGGRDHGVRQFVGDDPIDLAF